MALMVKTSISYQKILGIRHTLVLSVVEVSKICFYQVKNQFQMQSLSPAPYPQEYEYIEGGDFRDTLNFLTTFSC